MIIGFCCSKKDRVLNTATNRTATTPVNRRSGQYFLEENIIKTIFYIIFVTLIRIKVSLDRGLSAAPENNVLGTDKMFWLRAFQHRQSTDHTCLDAVVSGYRNGSRGVRYRPSGRRVENVAVVDTGRFDIVRSTLDGGPSQELHDLVRKVSEQAVDQQFVNKKSQQGVKRGKSFRQFVGPKGVWMNR